MKRSPEAKRLAAAREAAAKDLGLPESDWRVRRFAVLSIAYEGHESMLASGRGVDADTLLKLDTAMQEIRASLPPERITVELKMHGETINREGETIREGFIRMQRENRDTEAAEASQVDSRRVIPATESVATSDAPIENAGMVVAEKPAPKPYHETAVKDSRPGAVNGNGQSVVWSTPMNRERQF